MTRLAFSRSGTAYAVARMLPFLIIVASIVIDVATPDNNRYDRFLFAAPALAAIAWGPAATFGIGLLTMGASFGLAASRTDFQVVSGPVTLYSLLLVTLVSAWSSSLRRRRERQLQRMGSIAEATQHALLRPMPSRLGPVDFHLLYEASAQGARVGGDFYKALPSPDGVRLMVGDVQGKGLGAVETASLLLGSFRESAYTAGDLAEIARRLDTTMRRYASMCPDSEAADRFATVLLVEFPADEPVARILSCGHPAPLVQHGTAVTTVPIPSPALPVNLVGFENEEFDIVDIPFAPDDRLLLFTDGVSETRDAAGEFYPLEERVAAWSLRPADRVLPLLRDDLARFAAGKLGDDTTAILAVRH
ncbi:integral membrane protein [Streptomyces laurentii]|uniref:Integral membrane protein n=1 Tax=Streptomyces laurentii TaxID=39478 RepID=A0A160P9Q5_STRLU|nr:integral membrane protein [Streptomyces laurentii]